MTASGSGTGPRVTVLMAVYNGERYLDETVRSILGQTFTDFEFLIVDDGSKDSTPALLAKWAAADRRVVVLTNESNRGQGASVNRGLAAARGEYVARADADDVSEPGRLRTQVEVLDSRPDLVLVTMNYLLVRADGRVLRRTYHDAPADAIAYLLNYGNAIGGHSLVMFRRRAVLEAGGYDESLPVAQDYDLWARLSKLGGLLVLPGIGMRYRIHDDRISVRMGDRQRSSAAAVTRRMLSSWLERELSDLELESLTAIWSNFRPDVEVGPGLALLREGFRRLRQRDHPGRPLLRRVREENANRLAATGATLALAGRPLTAARLFAAALAWDARASVRRVLRLAGHAYAVWRVSRP